MLIYAKGLAEDVISRNYNEEMREELPFKVDLSDPLSEWRAGTFWTKEVETNSWLKHFSDSLNSGNKVTTLIDVGANIGIYTLYWLSLNPDSFAIACEPFQENLKLLNINLELNNFNSRVDVVTQPLNRYNTVGHFVLTDVRPGGSGYKFMKPDQSKKNSDTGTASMTLDQILLPLEKKYILKIDVDGNDFEILQGGEVALQTGNVISVLIESDGRKQLKIKNYLAKFGFQSDSRFDGITLHSDQRRISNGKPERNRVYSR